MIPDSSCNLAISYARLGKRDQALLMLDRAEKQNQKVGCGGNAGMVLEYLGDHVKADQAFADSIARMPDLADPYEQRGEIRFLRKDFAGAAADFAKAHEKSPHWADPLKYWGDALLAEKHSQEARAKYDAALACAPEWPELRDARAALPNSPISSALNPQTVSSCVN